MFVIYTVQQTLELEQHRDMFRAPTRTNFCLFYCSSALLSLIQGTADRVVLLDLSEGAAKGGTMDLDIFALPNVEISKGIRCCFWNGNKYVLCVVVLNLMRAGHLGRYRFWCIGHLFKIRMLFFHSFLLFFFFSG